jgi:hypothetical protein
VLEADDADAAEACAERIVDDAASSIAWNPRPRTVGAVRVASV